MPPITSGPKLANSLALYFAKMNQSMPIDRISVCDPFDYKKSEDKISQEPCQSKEKKNPKTLTYAKTIVNSESDLVYIRQGVSESSLLQKHEDYQMPLIQEGFKSMINEHKPISIGYKTYFMPQMIIACENLAKQPPNKSKKEI